jgi:CRP-like cAMP-binding protein
VRGLGTRAAFVVVGSILPLLTLASSRRLSKVDVAFGATRELELIERVPMFAPLSVAAKEALAAKLKPVAVAGGECVIRAGDTGDRFYIVAEGEFDVAVGEVHKRARPPDHFGEIALLRDIPRTASVTAVTDSRLFALERQDFLAAVMGHSGARTAGEEVVDARLRHEATPTGR